MENYMKKSFLALLLVITLALVLASCGGDSCEHADNDGDFICDICSEELEDNLTPPECEHKDENDDLICDECLEALEAPKCEHVDEDGDFACDKCGEELFAEGHTHSYTEKNTDSKYLSRGATCKIAAQYYFSCSCGEMSEETFASGEPLFYHDSKNGACIMCGIPNSTAGLEFELNPDGKTYTLTDVGDCTVPHVSIGIYNDLSVTAVAPSAFRNCFWLESVSIPNTVTKIGDNAFEDCTSLASIFIPESLKSVGSAAFWGCENLMRVYIKDIKAWCEISFNGTFANPMTLAEELYLNEEYVTELVIPSGVTEIKNYAFYGCAALERVTIPDSVTKIGSSVFDGCTALEYNEYGNAYYLGNENNPYLLLLKAKSSDITSCDINPGTKLIHSSAFANCTELSAIDLPAGITEICASAFFNCSSLSSVTLSDDLRSIGDSAFSYCTSLRNITIPESVTRICDSAFHGCVLLQSINIPSGVTEIGSRAFYGCENLESLTLSESVTSIGEYAFNDCDWLSYNEYGNALYLGNEENPYLWLILAKSTDIASCNIHKDTKFIYSRAFENCKALLTLTIPDGVGQICEYAFSGSALTSITLPGSVKSIGKYAFEYCADLASVSISEGVSFIGDGAFTGCSSLANISVNEANTAYKSIDGSLYSHDGSVLIRYAVGKGDTSFTIPTHVTEIGTSAFHSAKSLESLTVHDGVSVVGDFAFFDCKIKELHASADFITYVSKADLVTLVITSGKVIEANAFSGCENLMSVTISDGIYRIENHAFYGCTVLETVTIPKSVTHIEAQAFSGCTALLSAEFEKADGWYYTYYASDSSGTSIPSSDLQNPETAAQYLKSTYQYYHLKRTDYSILDKLPI